MKTFSHPLAVVSLLQSDRTVPDWDTTVLVRWMLRGCAQIMRDDHMLDVVTVAAATPEDLADTQLVIFHQHVVESFRSHQHHP